jgi:(1->4)-alpha-D-glucan 1-alpha-D-glucosylmutase
VRAFHRRNSERLKFWPHEMLATTTHDTKRSEDVRARINVLSEMPRLWQSRVRRWEKLNAMRKVEVDEESLPERNTEYLFYQTLIGTWPFFGSSQEEDRTNYAQRLVNYMLKAVREAKGRTSWVRPDEGYEKAVEQFVRAVIIPRRTEGRDPFLDDFLPFAEMVATLGLYNTLSQVALKYTVPGVPDLYQGTELMTLTLVDPDNRSPVDYDRRLTLLDELDRDARRGDFSPKAFMDLEQADRLKMYVTARLLGLRRDHATLFQEGDYQPVEVHGPCRDHVTAFGRVLGKTVILVVAGRLYHRLTTGAQKLPIGPVWQGTYLDLPWKGVWQDILSTGRHEGEQRRLQLSEVLAELPVAVLQTTIDPS